jgi:Protein of unknown function (DUF2934)
MPKRGRGLGWNATDIQEPSETAATVSPTDSEIATAAYLLWLDNGCPAGLDQEYWFRAEAMLKNALVARYEDLSRRPWIPDNDIRTESEMLVEFRWEGHWEVWESEWGGARWIWDLGCSRRRSTESGWVSGAVG